MKVWIIFFFLMGALVADERGRSYVLAKKGWEPPVGVRLQVMERREILNGKIKVTSDGSWHTRRFRSLDQSEVVLSRPSEDSYLCHFVSEAMRFWVLHEGRKTEQRKERAFHGKKVGVDRENGEWGAKVVEGDLDGVSPEELEKRLKVFPDDLFLSYGYAESFFGLEQRAVGESWVVDLPLIPGMAKGKVLEGRAEVFFEKVDKVRGIECAILKLDFGVKVDFTKRGGGVLDFTGRGKVVRSLETLFDIEFEAKGVLKAVEKSEGEVLESEGKCAMSREIFILPPVGKE